MKRGADGLFIRKFFNTVRQAYRCAGNPLLVSHQMTLFSAKTFSQNPSKSFKIHLCLVRTLQKSGR